MAQLSPYLTFNGNCEEAFTFYKSIFKTEYVELHHFDQMPSLPDMPAMNDELKQKIMHISLPISQDFLLMGSDSNPMMGSVTIGQNISLSINAQSRSEASTLFNGLSAGGVITMPLEDTFWGAYFGMFTDKFGINWMVNFDERKEPTN